MGLSKKIRRGIIDRAVKLLELTERNENELTEKRTNHILNILFSLVSYSEKFDSVENDLLVDGLFLKMESELEERFKENHLYQMGKDDDLTSPGIEYDVMEGEWYCKKCDYFIPEFQKYCHGCGTLVRTEPAKPPEPIDPQIQLIQEAKEALKRVKPLRDLADRYSQQADEALKLAQAAFDRTEHFSLENTNK